VTTNYEWTLVADAVDIQAALTRRINALTPNRLLLTVREMHRWQKQEYRHWKRDKVFEMFTCMNKIFVIKWLRNEHDQRQSVQRSDHSLRISLKKSLWQHFLQWVEVSASRQSTVFGSFQLDEQIARLVLSTFGFGVGALNESPRLLVRLLSAVELVGKPGQLLSRLLLSQPIQLLLQVVALRQALVQS